MQKEIWMTFKKEITLAGIAIIIAVASAFGLMAMYRFYNVWSMEKEGQASLMKATQTRQIQVEQAKAEKEAATLRAEAIAIIGKAAKEYPEYRTQEYIGAFAEALKEGKMQQIIYVPTEANIPVLEAGKRP